MKRKLTDLTKEEKIKTLDSLYTAAGSLKGRAAMKLFLRDLLTESERCMLGRRIRIAQSLLVGKTYKEIGAELQVGFDTIRRVDRWLSDQLPGYETAIKGMVRELHTRKARAETRAGWKKLKKKYPLHFLFFNF